MTWPYFEEILLAVSRWLHVMASTLIVGGTLFFEFVVPRGLESVRSEQQLAIIAYLRIVFRRFVWICVVVLPITGVVSIWSTWPAYRAPGSPWSAAFPWVIAHVAVSIIALSLAAALIIGGTVPTRSRQWMKLNFVLLMIGVLVASSARQVRLFTRQRIDQQRAEGRSPGQTQLP